MNDNWISVKNKLPESFEYILVCALNSGTYEPGYISIARYCEGHWEMLSNDAENNAVASGDFAWFIIAEEITHWMPLPKPPERLSL